MKSSHSFKAVVTIKNKNPECLKLKFHIFCINSGPFSVCGLMDDVPVRCLNKLGTSALSRPEELLKCLTVMRWFKSIAPSATRGFKMFSFVTQQKSKRRRRRKPRKRTNESSLPWFLFALLRHQLALQSGDLLFPHRVFLCHHGFSGYEGECLL